MLDKQNVRNFVLGGLAGAIAGILLAPRSGQELRGSIVSRAGEMRERGRETYFEAREKAQERFSGKGETYHQASTDPSPEEPVWEEQVPETEFTLEGGAAVGRTSSGAIPMPGDSAPSRPPLRDVSRDAPPEPPEENAEDLKRRIEETKARLHRRREISGEDADV